MNDYIWLNGIPYSDPLPIPLASGVGDVASLQTLIIVKVNVVTCSLDTLRLGATTGGRGYNGIRRDTEDVAELIRVNSLPP